MASMKKLKEQIIEANNLGINNLADKGVTVEEPIDTYKVMQSIAEIQSGGGDDESKSFIKALIERNANITELPNGLTVISDYAFYYAKNITINKIPDSVTKIGLSALDSCTALISLEALGVTEIANRGLAGCSNLKSANLPNVRIVAWMSFYNDTALETLILGTLTTAHQQAFQGCTALKNVTVGNGTTASLYLQYSDKLTQASVHGIIESYADMTGKTAPKLVVHDNCRFVDQTHLNMANVKNIEHNLVLAEG